MPLKINGHSISWSAIVSVLVFTFWLGGLSVVVADNSTDINEHSKKQGHEGVNIKLGKLETTQNAIKKTQEEIRKEQLEHKELLIKILQKVENE